VTLAVILLIASIRILFLLPAIATNTYAGLKTSWLQTRGHFERLLAVAATTYAPFFVIAEILLRLTRDRNSFPIGVICWIASRCSR
jgi:hypothetical protein